jgi:hypothetical protein
MKGIFKMNNLFLRTCNADGTSYGGFKWNLEISSITEAPDWNPEPNCGNGFMVKVMVSILIGLQVLCGWFAKH